MTDELAARRDAIDASGWGQRFRLVQPHNLSFWVYVVLCMLGAWQILQIGAGTGGFFASATLAGGIMFAILGLVWWAAIRLADRYERQPVTLVAAGVLWGGLAATFAIAYQANSANISLLGKWWGHQFATDWGAAISAPVVEETAKGAGFLLLMGLAPRLVRTVFDGLILGAFIGLGFEIFEDVLYAYQGSAAQLGVGQVQSAIQTFVTRGWTSLLSHSAYTALFCVGLIYLLGTPVQPRRAGLGVAFILAPLVAHGVWDGAAALSRGTPLLLVVWILDFALIIGMLVLAVRMGATQPRAWRRAILAPEVANGTMSAAELDAVAGGRKARKAFVRSAHGVRGKVAAKRVMAAADDLTEDLAAAGGTDSANVQHARAELTRLRAPHRGSLGDVG